MSKQNKKDLRSVPSNVDVLKPTVVTNTATIDTSKKLVDQIMTFVCCLLIALGINDSVFGNKWQGVFSVLAGIALMPGVMNWDYKSANKYQKAVMISIMVINFGFVGYVIYRYVK